MIYLATKKKVTNITQRRKEQRENRGEIPELDGLQDKTANAITERIEKTARMLSGIPLTQKAKIFTIIKTNYLEHVDVQGAIKLETGREILENTFTFFTAHALFRYFKTIDYNKKDATILMKYIAQQGKLWLEGLTKTDKTKR